MCTNVCMCVCLCFGGIQTSGAEASVSTLLLTARQLYSANLSQPELRAGPHIGPTMGVPEWRSPGL